MHSSASGAAISIASKIILFIFCFELIIGQNHTIAQNQKPNIILILADDIGYEIPTCNGGRSYETSNIDLIAINRIRFTGCYATPLCSPSRVEIMTGKYNFRNYYAWGKLDTTQKTFETYCAMQDI